MSRVFDVPGGLSRADYDENRPPHARGATACHAPSVGIARDREGRWAPCAHTTLRLEESDALSAWKGSSLSGLRRRFAAYEVDDLECHACVTWWRARRPDLSPAVEIFDPLANPLRPSQLAAATPRYLRLDLDAPLDAASLEAVLDWIPGVRRLELSLERPPGEAATRLLGAVSRSASREATVTLSLGGSALESTEIPGGTTIVRARGSLADLGRELSEAGLAGVARRVEAAGATLDLVGRIGTDDWYRFGRFVEAALRVGARPVPTPAEPPAAASLAHLAPLEIATIRDLLWHWGCRCGLAALPEDVQAPWQRCLELLRRWQAGSERPTSEVAAGVLGLPGPDDPQVEEERELLELLNGLLRVHAHPRVRGFLERVVASPRFADRARRRASLRLCALWLGATFADRSVEDALREIYESPTGARARVAADREAVAGLHLESALTGWLEHYRLDAAERSETFPTAPGLVSADSEPTVTVLIPSYRHEAYVERAVESAVGQRGVGVRVLVVDDASDDATLERAGNVESSRLEIHRNAENLGLGRSLAAALDLVKTPYVAVLNSDDLFHPDRLLRSLEGLERNPSAKVAATHLAAIDAEDRVYGPASSSPLFDGRRIDDWLRWFEREARPTADPSRDLFASLLARNWLVTTSNIVARTEALRATRDRWAELDFTVDWLIFLEAALDDALLVIPERLLGYRLHSANTVWFDPSRSWRHYLEGSRVAARVLARGYKRIRRDPARAGQVADALANHDLVDRPGLALGDLMNRQRLRPSEIAPVEFASAADGRSREEGEPRDDPAKTQGAELSQALAENAALELALGGIHRLRAEQRELSSRLTRAATELTRTRSELARARADRELLDRSRLLPASRWLWARWCAVRHRLVLARLAVERRWPRRRHRMMATICWNFPIYSQTFVYQELCFLQRDRFEVRHAFSKPEPREGLPARFRALWSRKRRAWQDPALHRADFERYRSRLPERVDRLVELLSDASSLTKKDVRDHADFLRAFTFTRMVEAWAPRYLHSYFFYDQSLHALVAASLLDIPRGVSCYADHLLNDYELKVVPLHLEQCDVIVATSDRIRGELLSLAPGVDPSKILVKPNAIDCDSFPSSLRADPSPGEPVRLVCVSRIEPKKGLLHLVEAVRLLREDDVNVELHLIGEVDAGVAASESYGRQLDDALEAAQLWGVVHLEGRRSHRDVRRFLDGGHIFVAPFVELASGDKDGIPTALLEAMSCGLPPVVTDAGSISEVVRHETNGLVVPQSDPRALASALSRLISASGLRAALGRAAAESVRREFDVAVRERELGDAIVSVLASRP